MKHIFVLIKDVFDDRPPGRLSTREIQDALAEGRSLSSIQRALKRLKKSGEAVYDTVKGRRVWSLTGTVPAAPQPTGGSSMCIDPNKPTFNAAIESVVTELTGGQKKFSAFDVTKRLRERVGLNAGDPLLLNVDPKETGTVHFSGKDIPKIVHEEVKKVVHDLFHQGKLASYDRVHTGTFWQYEPAQANTILPGDGSSAPASDPSAPSTAGGSYDGNPTL